MKFLASGAALLAGLLLLAPGVHAADEPIQAMIDGHADSVVTVKFVLHLQVSMRGETREMEQSGESTGVVVDAAGLVVLPDRVLNPHARGPGGREIDIKATPSNVRVVFPGDPKEYEAIVGATDSKLGLAFVRIKDLGERVLAPVSLDGDPEITIGERLYGVSRLDQGFDYAPWCDSVQVAGHVTKPRKLWMLRGGFTEIAHPLFRADGTAVGFVILQEGVGGGRTMPFLLPLKVAASTVERAARQAERVLEDEASESASPAAEGAGEGEKPQPEAPETPEDGPTPPDSGG